MAGKNTKIKNREKPSEQVLTTFKSKMSELMSNLNIHLLSPNIADLIELKELHQKEVEFTNLKGN